MRIIAVISMTFLLSVSGLAFADEVTLREVEDFFATTTNIYEPAEKIDGFQYPGYYHPVVYISDLWERLGIRTRLRYMDAHKYVDDGSDLADEYIFLYKPEQDKECILHYPETRLYGTSVFRILRVTSSCLCWDYQYLIFKKRGNDWVFLDHIDIYFDKYAEPELQIMSDNLFGIKTMVRGGTGILSYRFLVYSILDDEINLLLSLPCEGERFGWEMLFNYAYETRLSYYVGTLYCDYKIKTSANAYMIKEIIESDEDMFDLFEIERKVVFDWVGQKFVINQERSDFTLEDLDKLEFGGYEDYYSLFKNEFEELKERGEMQRKWYMKFMEEVKEATQSEGAV